MTQNNKPLIVIPARGGSKGIPRKNLASLGGFPLITHVIRAALQAKITDHVLVTTDSEEIAQVAKTMGAQVPFLRPEELASDTATTYDAVKHAVEECQKLGWKFDDVILLQPTQPFLRSESIIKGYEHYLSNDRQSLVGLSPLKNNPVLTRYIDDEGKMHRLLDSSSTVRRQDMKTYYRVNGALYINRVEDILAGAVSFNDNTLPFIMSELEGFDIDDPADLFVARHLIGMTL